MPFDEKHSDSTLTLDFGILSQGMLSLKFLIYLCVKEFVQCNTTVGRYRPSKPKDKAIKKFCMYIQRNKNESQKDYCKG